MSQEKAAQNMDKDFFKRTDAFIQLANQLSQEQDLGKVSASLLYAAARFNAFIVASSAADKAEADRNKVQAIEYFTNQYRAMLIANMDDYIEKFDEYL
ncbi:MAG: DUF3144 domain-containing protein, partial [Oceanospirillaceae bacterium]|nr:DUF3144 domain-containing protein [Oceanospirillaceae bacterium]